MKIKSVLLAVHAFAFISFVKVGFLLGLGLVDNFATTRTEPHRQFMIDNNTNKPNSESTKSRRRRLTFEDLTIGKYLGRGWINVVSIVELPQWWYEQERIDKGKQFVVKLAAGWGSFFGDLEIEVLETLWKNTTLAKKHRIIPYAFLQRSFANPFYNSSMSIPKSFPEECQKRLRTPELAALVIPYMDLRAASEQIDSLQGIKRFIKSLLETLAYSHSVGINNFDLHEMNMKIDKSGYAVITGAKW